MKALGALSLMALLIVGSGCDDAEVEPTARTDWRLLPAVELPPLV